MTDYFALLQQERRPWLDPDSLKEQFHRLSVAAHPDTGGATTAFASLTAAYRTLNDPASRLRHLLELTFPDSISSSGSVVPPGLTSLFMILAEQRSLTEAFLKKYRATHSPLAKAMLASEKAELGRRLNEVSSTLDQHHSEALERLRDLDARWTSSASDLQSELVALYAELSYLGKWHAQLREVHLQMELLG